MRVKSQKATIRTNDYEKAFIFIQAYIYLVPGFMRNTTVLQKHSFYTLKQEIYLSNTQIFNYYLK
jgi:hypothetical protein